MVAGAWGLRYASGLGLRGFRGFGAEGARLVFSASGVFRV